MHSFSIIIVSWNALHHLKTFLPSVTRTDYPDYEIILADNASDDGSAAWVRERYPSVKIATFDDNYGYCGGNNRAVSYTDGDILLFLNNDVEVEQNWLHALNKCFEENPDAGAAQPKMLAYEQPDHFEYAGAAGGFLDKHGYPFCRGRIFDTLEKDRGQYNKPSDIFWASGAALAIRKDLFKELGGFDEDFEFHMEEIDLCWRLQNAGYKVRYCPESVVYHLGGGSMPMGSPRKVFYNYRNNLKMIWKNSSRDSLLSRFTARYFLDIIAAKRSLFTGQVAEFWAIARAHVSFWKSFSKIRRKRKELQQNRKIDVDPETLMPFSIVREYFFRKHTTFEELPVPEQLKVQHQKE